MYRQLLNLNSSPILELSVKFVSQICHENINKPLDGTYLADFGIDIIKLSHDLTLVCQPFESWPQKRNCNESLALTKEAPVHVLWFGKCWKNILKIIKDDRFLGCR